MTSFSRRFPPLAGIQPGFALVVSLSLMVLITVIALGLLTLSSVSLRASVQEESMAVARGNARLALTLAIGQLQKAAGPDQRITAPGNVLHPTAHPGLTGVWESRRSSPEGDGDLDAVKRRSRSDEAADGEFVGWLGSDALRTPGAGPGTLPERPSGAGAATLVGDPGTPVGPLTAPILPVEGTGGLAWHTLDEGVKVRLDLPQRAPLNRDAKLARLRAPARPAPESIEGLGGLSPDEELAGKLVSLGSGRLAVEDPQVMPQRMHDVTLWASSLPVNVVDGGLKADLTRAFEQATLPAAFAGRYVYSNSKTPLAPADPMFSSLAGFYRLQATTGGGTRPLSVTVPSSYRPTRSDRGVLVPNPAPVNGTLVAPVVSRVSLVFSLISREAHGHWVNTVPNTTGDPQRTYMVYLIYTPVVTLYNPYNTPLNISQLKITFKYLPVAFRFFRNGVPQTNAPSLLSQFHVSSENRNDWEDQFTVTLSSTPGSSSGATLTLAPGEARVFGVNHPRGTRWGSMTNYLWQNDLGSSKTLNLFTGPGWNYRSGFIVDWLRPAASGRTADNSTLGVFGARGNDTIDVACTPEVPGGSNGQFSIDVTARVSGREMAIGSYRYRYGTRQKLVESLKSGSHPSLGPIDFPFAREKPWRMSELFQPNVETLPIEEWTGPKQFAIFTLVDRTALDSLNPWIAGQNGSFVRQVLDMDVTRSHPAQQPMELAFMPIRGDGANVVGSIDVAPDDTNRAYHFSGTRLLTGSLNYPSIQIPATPLVNVATFRHANLTSSGHFPMQTHTVGESAAHPAIPADRALGPAGTFGYVTADASWLSNRTLWDATYFSTLATQAQAAGFFRQETRLPNERMAPALAAGQTPESAAADATAADAWLSNAARQRILGGFNVNSTSVAAWKAMLASLRESAVPVLEPVRLQEQEVVAKDAAFPRHLRGASGSIDHPDILNNQTRWAGFRELSDEQLETIATQIVEQVRERGPFLSMAEFVNRRLEATGDRSRAGAIETAIRRSGVNGASGGTRLITADQVQDHGHAHPAAATGDAEAGANAFLSQGDVLEALGATLTVRSDTFLIRAYGEARDGQGRVLARARCEAVLQRAADHIDPADAPDMVQALLDDPQRSPAALRPVNQRFGRRFDVVSFRWLSPAEI